MGLHGTPRDFNMIPRDFNGFYGTPWDSLGLRETSKRFQGISMGSMGLRGSPRDFNVIPRDFNEFHGTLRDFIVIPRNFKGFHGAP